MRIETIADLQKEYFGQIDHLDFDLIVAHIIKKPREFVMSHPEFGLSTNQKLQTTNYLARRMKNEPLAYILGHKEFYALNFKVTPDTLIPRPETELIVELAIQEAITKKPPSTCRDQKINIIDIGTGSGNIIISLAKNLVIDSKFEIQNSKFFATDISSAALTVAKSNARLHNVNKKIKFLQGDLLEPFIQDTKYKIQNTILIANLPYLSQKIYSATLPNVKKFEPKSALYSPKEGLSHYEKLFKQIVKFNPTNCTIYLEISPEQKTKLPKIIKTFLPKSKIEFKKDLASRWRVCKIII
jgi:release factor glutamine methyltransferase